MPEFQIDISGMRDEWNALDWFTQGFVEAAFFCGVETGDDSDKSDEFGLADLAPDALEKIQEICAKFKAQFEADIEALDGAEYGYCEPYDEKRAGNDLFFTACGHGVGFWSREFTDPDAKDAAARLSESCGRVYCEGLYQGDDENVYCLIGYTEPADAPS